MADGDAKLRQRYLRTVPASVWIATLAAARAHLTRGDIAAACGVSHQTIGRWCSGERLPPASRRARYVAALSACLERPPPHSRVAEDVQAAEAACETIRRAPSKAATLARWAQDRFGGSHGTH